MSDTKQFTIIGAGLAGLSASYHLEHTNCLVFEQKDHIGGHVFTHSQNGFYWDEGPHVSFTKHKYVREIFEKSLNGEFLEYKVYPTNFYKGHWIPHPAQSNLFAVPEPLRTECLNDFLKSRDGNEKDYKPENYEEWLVEAFGKRFYETFPLKYTEKYWTVPPSQLNVDWIGSRVYYPDVDVVKAGSIAPPDKSTHYITEIRYPKHGGYFSFIRELAKNFHPLLNKKVKSIDLEKRKILFADKQICTYKRLINTMPLPEFVSLCSPPTNVMAAANNLVCTQLLLINFEIDHPSLRNEQWVYVYDDDMLSTRINFIDLLSPNNVPKGKSGIQVEVYFSKFRPCKEPFDVIAKKVTMEIERMGLIKTKASILSIKTQFIPFANVVFDHYYRDSLDVILNWLTNYGLLREDDDLLPMTEWNSKKGEKSNSNEIIMAGRFGQWKYYWTDDCVLRGKFIKEAYA